MQMFTRGCSHSSSQVEDGPHGPGASSRPARADSLGDDQAAALLLRTIEAEIIPRLMLAHRPCSNDDRIPDRAHCDVDPADVDTLCKIILGRDPGAALTYVQSRRAEGLSLDKVYLNLLSPVAQRLGALWEADLCDFTQVTVALWRLQQIVHEYSPTFQREGDGCQPPRRALLVPAPGSQHTLGVVIVGEFFRRAGWDVGGDPRAGLGDIQGVLSREWYDLVGVSVGRECKVDEVASAILGFRKASLNRAVVVMVGGPAMALMTDLVTRVGADGSAPDAPTAVIEADRLLAAVRAAPT